MTHTSTTDARPTTIPPTFEELARWDGDQLTIRTGILLDETRGGPAMIRIRVGFGTSNGGGLEWEPPVDQPMARIPLPTELYSLAAAANFAWTRRERIVVLVEVRPMTELEARAAWGDR